MQKLSPAELSKLKAEKEQREQQEYAKRRDLELRNQMLIRERMVAST